jgi:hypothetical protein
MLSYRLNTKAFGKIAVSSNAGISIRTGILVKTESLYLTPKQANNRAKLVN